MTCGIEIHLREKILKVKFIELSSHWEVKWVQYGWENRDMLLKTDLPHAVMNFMKKHRVGEN